MGEAGAGGKTHAVTGLQLMHMPIEPDLRMPHRGAEPEEQPAAPPVIRDLNPTAIPPADDAVGLVELCLPGARDRQG